MNVEQRVSNTRIAAVIVIEYTSEGQRDGKGERKLAFTTCKKHIHFLKGGHQIKLHMAT